MKSFIQNGDALDLVAPHDVFSGAGMQVGSIFGIASTDALQGAQVTAAITGVFSLDKVAEQPWSAGDRIYWDATTKLCTTTAAGNLLIGSATVDAANPTATGSVRLDGASDRRQVLQAAATLDFASIAASASADLTIAVSGAAVGDPVALSPPSAPQAGLVFFAFVSAANTVTVRATNITGSGVDAASASYSVAIIKA